MNEEDDNQPKTLSEYSAMIKTRTCRWCNKKLNTSPENIKMYPHEGGLMVRGQKNRQWLYITCDSDSEACGYDWALWKLGVPGRKL